MDPLHDRVDALESQIHTLQQQTRAMARRLRWWRGLAASLMVLAVLTWALPTGIAQDEASKGLEQRVAALEDLLKHFSREGNELFITGANVHLVNGLGSTDCGSNEAPMSDCPNGLGNLIVGYNEPREGVQNIRTGSHNIVVGEGHDFSRFGGLVVGEANTISGDFATVSGGSGNTASGRFAVVSGGQDNTARGEWSAVSGGFTNAASGYSASVSGGSNNTASGGASAVSGGSGNTASGGWSSISGGTLNTASGVFAAVSGGSENTAEGFYSAVSGGLNRTAAGEFDWVAGSLFEDE
jgi:trimeric autotransporter adhesin